MTASQRNIKSKNEQFSGHVTKRGVLSGKPVDRVKKSKAGPILTGFFIFVVVGSALFQLLNMFLNSTPQE